MNILLVGGPSVFINRIIRKFKKEGHKVCLLTGNRFNTGGYEKAFETYCFPYDSESIKSIFESADPDVTIYFGAYDSNFEWDMEQNTSVRFTSSLMNLLTFFDTSGKGRFIYLSSDEVYGGDWPEDIREEETVKPETIKGAALAQGENICSYMGDLSKKDIVTLRLQHLYGMPESAGDCNETITWFCLETLRGKILRADAGNRFALLYESDAVEFLYEVAVCEYHRSSIYNISSSVETNEAELAEIVFSAMKGRELMPVDDGWGDDVDWEENDGWEEVAAERSDPRTGRYAKDFKAGEPVILRSAPGVRRVLSNERFVEEFRAVFFGSTKKNVNKIAGKMKRYKRKFLTGEELEMSFWKKLQQRAGWFFKAIIPFLENIICFIFFYRLNQYVAGSTYFSRLDFYLLYVLLFAIVHGQHQAIFSAALAMGGHFFSQAAGGEGFAATTDYTNYVWITQLFIVGLTVGYQRDNIRSLRDEMMDERIYLSKQLVDINDINGSNVRVKNALTTQIINQNDSVGKIYNITSTLNKLMPEEILFQAATMLGELMESRDVAIYTVSNGQYARLFSYTTPKAKKGGNSICYREYGALSEALKDHRVYINRELDERYPMMASAIYDDEEMEIIVMIWSISWDRMTLGQADYLVVCGYLIQNAVIHANRYLSALRDERYVKGLELLKGEAFDGLVRSFLHAREKGLTECVLLEVDIRDKALLDAGKELRKNLRNNDYVGIGGDHKLLVLLSNAGRAEADVIMKRFEEKGYVSRIKEEEGIYYDGGRAGISDFTYNKLRHRASVPAV